MYELAREPSDIGRVIDGGIKLFTGSIKSVFLPALVAAIVMYIPELLGRMLGQAEDAAPGGVMIAGFLLVFVLLVLLYLSLYTAIILKIWTLARGENADISELIGRGFSLLPPVIMGSILFTLAVIIGMILLVIPGIYLSVALCLFYLAIVIDGRGPFEGIKYSFRLIKGHWWRTLLILMIPSIIIMVLFMVVGIVAGILAFVLAGFVTEGMLFEIIIESCIVVAQAFSTPFFICLMLVLYHDLKLRQEPASGPELHAENPANSSQGR